MMYRYRLIIALLVSLNLHAALFFSLSFSVAMRSNPVFYFWPGILSTRDIERTYRARQDFEWAHISGRVFEKNDFSAGVTVSHPTPMQPKNNLAVPLRMYGDSDDKKYLKEASGHLYLWERSVAIPYREEEAVAYKVLVSPEGKVVLSFPEKLPLDSYGSLAVQQYIKEAAFFLKEKYFWTKVKSKVK